MALLSVVATGLAVTFSFHALLDNFNTNCISGAKLVFKTTTDDDGGGGVGSGGVDDNDEPSSASIADSSAASLALFVPPLLSTGNIGSEYASTETPRKIVPNAYGQPNDGASGGNGPDGAKPTAAEPARPVGSVRWWLRARQNYSEQFREHFEPLLVIDAKLGVNKLRQMTLQASGLVMGSSDDQRLDAIVRQQLARNEEDIEFFDSRECVDINSTHIVLCQDNSRALVLFPNNDGMSAIDSNNVINVLCIQYYVMRNVFFLKDGHQSNLNMNRLPVKINFVLPAMSYLFTLRHPNRMNALPLIQNNYLYIKNYVCLSVSLFVRNRRSNYRR